MCILRFEEVGIGILLTTSSPSVQWVQLGDKIRDLYLFNYTIQSPFNYDLPTPISILSFPSVVHNDHFMDTSLITDHQQHRSLHLRLVCNYKIESKEFSDLFLKHRNHFGLLPPRLSAAEACNVGYCTWLGGGGGGLFVTDRNGVWSKILRSTMQHIILNKWKAWLMCSCVHLSIIKLFQNPPKKLREGGGL